MKNYFNINRHFLENFFNVCKEESTKQAFVFGNESVSFIDLYTTSKSISNFFPQEDNCKNSLVFIFSNNSIDLVKVFLGALFARYLPSLMPLPSSKQDPERYWKSHSELFNLEKPALIIAPSEFIDQLRLVFSNRYKYCAFEDLIKYSNESTHQKLDDYILSNSDSELPLVVQHSSGTTGLKKGVVLNSLIINKQVKSYASSIGVSSKDVIVSWLPMYHDMGFVACMLLPLLCGLKVVLIDPFKWVARPHLLFKEIDAHSGTLIWMPNFAFHLLQKTLGHKKLEYNLSSVRAFINCSEPCKKASFDVFYESFKSLNLRPESLQCCYAMAETVFAITQTDIYKNNLNFNDDHKFELAVNKYLKEYLPSGKVIPGVDISIIDSSGIQVSDGHIGQITIKSEFLFSGYFMREDLTFLKVKNDRYFTGDLGFIFNSELYVIGRLDDLIVSHGKKVIAHEVESYFNKFDFVKPGRALIFPLPNVELQTNDLAAVIETTVVTVPESALSNLKNLLFSDLGVELTSVFVVPNGWLIKSTSGKISRQANIEKFINERSSLNV